MNRPLDMPWWWYALLIGSVVLSALAVMRRLGLVGLAAALVLSAGAASAQPKSENWTSADSPTCIGSPSSCGYTIASVVENMTPNEWTACYITLTHHDRPKVKPGGRVTVLVIEGPNEYIEIPWPEGLSAVEAVRAWRVGR